MLQHATSEEILGRRQHREPVYNLNEDYLENPRVEINNDPQARQLLELQLHSYPRRGNGNPVANWQIRFDGSVKGLGIDDFLFRVETLARAEGVSQTCLVYAIHQLLTGKAATWYWQFCRKFPRVNWSQLCYSLRREFEDPHTDVEIRKAMEARKQRPRETFSDFRLDMEGLALRLRNPIGPNELLNLMRQNMHPALRKSLILKDFDNLDEMDRMCRQMEKMWTEIGETADDQIRCRRHNVYELQYGREPPQEFYETAELSEIAEVSRDGALDRGSRHTYTICWNCDDIGHSYVDCPRERQRNFCYSCGAKGVIKWNCIACTKGNRQAGLVPRGNWNPRTSSTPHRSQVDNSKSDAIM